MTTIDKLPSKFRDMARRLESEIAAKRSDRRANTPKQSKEAASARIDADHLDRVREALLTLADARESGTLPDALGTIRSKSDLERMLRTRIDCSGGYYSIRDTGEFSDKSDMAVKLREFVDAKRSRETAAQREVVERRKRIADMEASVKFSDIPGFFPTPKAVIERMLELADVRPGMHVLEPSAGKGDIADSVAREGAAVKCVEVNYTLCGILAAKGHDAIRRDFLELLPRDCMSASARPVEEAGENNAFDRVLLNPPFERGQDIEHVQHAYKFLRSGGRLVSVMSSGPFFRSDKKSEAFREWLLSVGGTSEDLEAGAFNGSFRSTGVSCKLVVIDKK